MDPILIFWLIALILSIIIHEVAHGYAALSLGDKTALNAGRLTLNPIPHIDLIGSVLVPLILVLQAPVTGFGFVFGWAKPVPYNPYNLKNQRWGEAIVSIAGVATNLVLAVLFAGVAHVAAGAGNSAFADLAKVAVFVNLSLGLFNLMPIPPLDGFGFLRGILPGKLSQSLAEFEHRINSLGFVSLIVILLIFSYFLSEPFGWLVRYAFELLV